MSPRIRKSAPLPFPYGRPLTEVAPTPSRSAGRTLPYKGYLVEYAPDHPGPKYWGHVFQHRLVAEATLGRLLTRREVVHHEDRCKTNNDPANLWVFPDQAAHSRHHKRDSYCHRLDLAERLLPLAQDPRCSRVQAGRELGVDQQTVKAICQTHGIRWVSAAVRQLAEPVVREALQGRTTQEAAEVLGVSHQTLRSRFGHLLLKRAAAGSLEPHREVIRGLATSTRADALGRRYGVNPETVKMAIRRWAQQEPGAWSSVVAYQRSRRGLGRPPRRKA